MLGCDARIMDDPKRSRDGRCAFQHVPHRAEPLLRGGDGFRDGLGNDIALHDDLKRDFGKDRGMVAAAQSTRMNFKASYMLAGRAFQKRQHAVCAASCQARQQQFQAGQA